MRAQEGLQIHVRERRVGQELGVAEHELAQRGDADACKTRCLLCTCSALHVMHRLACEASGAVVEAARDDPYVRRARHRGDPFDIGALHR